MGIGKEAVELGIKGVQKLTPEIQKYMKGFLGETKQKLVSDMARNGHPKYQTIYQNLDTLRTSTDESVKETLGLNVHKDLDGILADGQQLQTSRNAQRTLNKAVESDQSIRSTLFGGSDTQPITSDQLTELGKKIRSKEIEAPQVLTNRNEELATLQREGLLERGPQNRFEAIFFGADEFVNEKDVPTIIRRFRSETLDNIGLGRTDIKKNRQRDRGRPGVRLNREGKLTLGEDQGFYAGTPKGSHAHHWTPLAVLDKVVEGMSPKQVNTFLKYLERELQIFGGNHIGNLRQLPDNIHNLLHRRLDALGYNPQSLQSFAKATLKERKAFMKKMKLDFDKLEEEIFTEMMVRKGNVAGPQLKPSKTKLK